MAKQEVSGKTAEELEQLRKEYEERHKNNPDAAEFEETYCLAKIPVQPDDYDGPERYCFSAETQPLGSNWVCRHHGGAGEPNENISDHDGSESMTHGMFATVENLINDFDKKDEALYKWVLREYPKAYDIDLDTDPASQYDLHRLAAEIVRAERGRGHLIEEGEVRETERVDPETGQVVIDESGDIVTEKSEHYLADVLHRQDKKITQLEKELGISRRERHKMGNEDSAAEAIQTLASLGDTFIQRDEHDYDPDETPWNDD